MAKRTIHDKPTTNLSENAPKEAALIEFGRRLQRAMIQKGWNQSELARQATTQMVKGEVSRDLVSKYVNGKTLPSAGTLDALAKALKMAPADLLPTRGVTAAGEKASALDVRDLGEGMVWLRVNQQIEWPKAMKILAIINGED